MNRTVALFVGLAAALLCSRAAGADEAADAEKRFKDAFKPLKLPAAAKIEKDVVPTLPQGIVVEPGPFDAIVRRLLEPHEPQLAARDEAMSKIGAAADPVAAVISALGVMDAENAELGSRVAAVEASYSEVWDADTMSAGEKEKRARKLAAVLIPFYRTLSARNQATAAAAPDALAKGGDAARTARLVATASADASPAARAAAVAALARVGGPDALAALKKVRAADVSAGVRTKALAALCAFKAADMKDAAVAALADSAWQARALAAAVCARGKFVEAAGALVLGIEKEDGRLRKDFDDALQALCGVRFWGDAALAKKWWADNEAAVAEKAKALAAAGEYEKPVGPPETWDDAAAESAEKAKGVTSSFFGIATPSKRVLFVVDISFSMLGAAVERPAATTGVSKDAYPAPAGPSKMDLAKWQLHRAVAALPKDAAFDVVLFSESYMLWQEQMVEATDKTKAKAHEFIDAIRPNGTTNIGDSLDKALELAAGAGPAARGGPKVDLAADTVYLMTDGKANRGRLSDEAKLLESVVARNRAARLVFHAVGIGEAAGSEFLQSLAKRTGGQYVGFK